MIISEVAADMHEPMLPQRIMRANEQLDPQCSQQTYHLSNELH